MLKGLYKHSVMSVTNPPTSKNGVKKNVCQALMQALFLYQTETFTLIVCVLQAVKGCWHRLIFSPRFFRFILLTAETVWYFFSDESSWRRHRGIFPPGFSDGPSWPADIRWYFFEMLSISSSESMARIYCQNSHRYHNVLSAKGSIGLQLESLDLRAI